MSLRALAVAACAAGALGVAACGGGGSATATRTAGGGPTVDLYSSFPMQGPASVQAAALVKGIRLAIDEAVGRAGTVSIRYTALDDSTARAGGWDPAQTAHDARVAAHDTRAVGYIGEFNSRATEVSLPILTAPGSRWSRRPARTSV